MLIRTARLRLTVAAALLGTAACGTSEGDGGTGPGDDPAIAIAVNPASLTVQAGGSGTVTATITRSGGFTGAVTIETTGAPTGVTATASNVSTSNGTTTGTITVTVAPSVATGTYQISINASGSGVETVSTEFQLTVTAAPAFGRALEPTSLSVTPGEAGTVAVTIDRTAFTGDVALTVEGVPAGVTATLDPATTSGSSSTLTVAVDPGTAEGTHDLLIRGTAAGLADATASLSLTIAPAVGSFSVSTTPAGSIALQQGGAGTATIDIDRSGGYAGTVDLSVAGAPSGLTASVAPASTTGDQATLSLGASSTLAPGSYDLTITGAGTGVASQMVDLTVNVTAAPSGGSIIVDFSSCDLVDRPIWFAIQDGMGSGWTTVQPVNHVYSFDLTQTFGGVAFVVTDQGSYTTAAWLMHRTDLLGITSAGFCDDPVGKTITGTVANLPTASTVRVSLGGATAAGIPTGATTANVTLGGVEPGVHDLVGYAAGAAIGASDRMMIRRDQNLPDGGSFGTLDAMGTESFSPAAATFTLAGLQGGEVATHGMFYYTTSACTAATLYGSAPVAGSNFAGYGAPASEQRASDFHGLLVQSFGGTSSRQVTEFFQTMGSRTVTLPAAMPDPTVSTLTAPFARLRFQYTVPTGLDGILGVTYGDGDRAIALVASGPGSVSNPGYFGSTMIDFVTPDFDAAPGYDPAWAPPSSATVDYGLFGTGSTGGGACTEGGRSASATRFGTH